VNLIGVIGWPTDIMFDQTATFKHRHLGEIFAHLHAHHVATQWTSIALFATTALDKFGVGFDSRRTR
jgi:hypothetical protein